MKTAAILIAFILLPIKLAALDFDRDGFDDFLLIEVSGKQRLQWYAIDLNDPARRPLGQFGRLGDHLAAGSWAAGDIPSKGLVKRASSDELEWSLQLPEGAKNIMFGRPGDMAVSGLDIDNNGTLDLATVSKEKKNLVWRFMPNPFLPYQQAVHEVRFGKKGALPFFANIDGKGERIGTAERKNNNLNLTLLDIHRGKQKKFIIKNYRDNLSGVLPVARANGRDVLFLVSKQGKKITLSLLKGKKVAKTIKLSGDEAVVGRYFGTKSEVLVVRNKKKRSTFIDPLGRKSVIDINLNGILADAINLNDFAISPERSGPKKPASGPNAPPETPALPSGSNPPCAGNMPSTEHLLYKPISDTSGNVVLVFDSKYSQEFMSVKIELKDGSFAEGWWRGLELWGNPDQFGPRQHWRTNVRYGSVKDKALIIAVDANQECRFQLPGSSSKRWE